MGSLISLSVKKGPDVRIAASMLGIYVKSSTRLVLVASKRVLGYLKGTMNMFMMLQPGENTQLNGFVDSTFGSNTNRKQRSRSGALIKFSCTFIQTTSYAQKYILVTSTKREYVALSYAVRTISWLRQLMTGISLAQTLTTIILDNMVAIE